MPWPAVLSNLRTDIVAGMARAGVEAAEFAKHAVAINNLEANASPNTHTHSGTTGAIVPWQFECGWMPPNATEESLDEYIHTATTVITVRARRRGGAGATIDVKDNGVSILSTPLSLTTNDTWMTATLVTSPTVIAATHTLVGYATSVSGAVDKITISVEGTRVGS